MATIDASLHRPRATSARAAASAGSTNALRTLVRRPRLLLGTLAAALAVSGLQLAVLMGAAVLRGAEFSGTATGIAWFLAAGIGLVVVMYGVAETLANRIPSQEEYVGALPAVAIDAPKIGRA